MKIILLKKILMPLAGIGVLSAIVFGFWFTFVSLGMNSPTGNPPTGTGNAITVASGTAANSLSIDASGKTTADLASLKINGTTVTATAAELNFVDGVTSAIQTQLGLKAPLAGPTFTGTVTVPAPVAGGAASTKDYVDAAVAAAGSAGASVTLVGRGTTPSCPAGWTAASTGRYMCGVWANYSSSYFSSSLGCYCIETTNYYENVGTGTGGNTYLASCWGTAAQCGGSTYNLNCVVCVK